MFSVQFSSPPSAARFSTSSASRYPRLTPHFSNPGSATTMFNQWDCHWFIKGYLTWLDISRIKKIIQSHLLPYRTTSQKLYSRPTYQQFLHFFTNKVQSNSASQSHRTIPSYQLSLHGVLEMTALGTNISLTPFTPLVNSHIDNVLGRVYSWQAAGP